MKHLHQKTNRLLSWILITALLCGALLTGASAQTLTAASPLELYSLIGKNLAALNEEFTVDFTGDMDLLSDPEDGKLYPAELVRRAVATLPNSDGSGLDPHMLNINQIGCSWSGNRITFTVDYLQDAAQLAWVAEQVQQILDGLELEQDSDLVKIKKIYEYVCRNFSYDYTYSQFTDYEGLTTGTMVCQGYSLLLYKLLWGAGVPCRIVVGISSGEAHGWNLVKLGNSWYNLDATWDSTGNGAMKWNYFLKSEADFRDHARGEMFTSAAYTLTHPMAQESFSLSAMQVIIDGEPTGSLIIRNGRSLMLSAALSTGQAVPVRWSSSNPAAVSITEDGFLESLTPGHAYITAVADDPDYLPIHFSVTAVDLTSCSPWAEEELNRYYLRSLYPAELCSSFQAPITREEFARLLEMLISQVPRENKLPQESGILRYPNFTDANDSPYFYSILYCAARGIFEGTSETTFSPTAPVTREQAAKLLCAVTEFFLIPLPEGEIPTFSDQAEISPWAVPYVEAATADGLIQGTGDAFRPKDPLTREQAALILERLYANVLFPEAV